MLEVMKESEGNTIGFRATGKLTRKDYDEVLAPRLAALAQQFGSVRALVYMDDGFKGWDLPAAWANTKLDMHHRGDLAKVAIVGAPVWEEWCVRMASLLMKGELRTFRSGELQAAWDWIKG